MKNRIETIKDREAEHKRQIMIERHKLFEGSNWREKTKPKEPKGSSSPEDYKIEQREQTDSEKATMSKGK